ncbi:hypothetical protein YC2023_024297 [Brassica napus]
MATPVVLSAQVIPRLRWQNREISGKLLGKNIPVSFPPASRQDPDPRVPDKGKLQVPARRNPKFGP